MPIACSPPARSLDEPRLVAFVKRFYRPLLEAALARGRTVQWLAALLALPALVFAFRLGTDFLPALDEGAIMVQTVLPSDASLSAVDEANQRFERELAGLVGVAASYPRTGRGEITEFANV